MKKFKIVIMTLVFISVFLGCEDLEVENLNDPDREALLANPAEFPASVNGAYATFWGAIQYSNYNFPMTVMAQGLSMSWGNWGARDVGTIPRQALQNNLTYGSRGMFTAAWNGLYAALGQANGIMSRIANDGITVPDGTGNDITAQVTANIRALQGLSLGYLSLIYNQAYIVDETSDISNLSFSPYSEVNDAAIAKLETAIAAFAGSSFQMTGWNGLVLTGDEAAQFLRSVLAKVEAVQARNAGEAAAVDWAKVLTNTADGVQGEMAPLGDGFNVWWHRLLNQGQDGGWARVPQKVIKMMNPSKPDTEVPYPWPDGVGTFPEITTPDDNRVLTDYTYNESVPFSAARGYYFYGNYDYSRYEAWRSGFTGPMVWISEIENNLLRAEALIRTGGSKADAAALINVNRVGRGQLAPLDGSESDADLLNAITYERVVELTFHGGGNAWYYRRMQTPAGNTDATNLYYLEPATARHLPVPADELSIFGFDFYTYGGNEPEQ